MTIQEATYFLLNRLRTIYPDSEAGQMTDWVMETLTGSKKAERMIYKNSAITRKEEIQLQEWTQRLMKHEPIQYVLNEAWFCGLKFYVDQHVLIPRPETEELVEWVQSVAAKQQERISILDIGTGSGCISISLKKKLTNAEIWSCDISEAALNVAKRNAETIGADIHFILVDFLNKELRKELPSFDMIVSNPPYVPEEDKGAMQRHVLEYEPHLALFVPDNDPLIFYHTIADFGKTHLHPGGAVYVEIHEELGQPVIALFRAKGYQTTMRKDLQGKDRMLKAWL